MVHDWVMQGLGMSSPVCATGYINGPLPLVDKSRDRITVVGFLLVSFIKLLSTLDGISYMTVCSCI